MQAQAESVATKVAVSEATEKTAVVAVYDTHEEAEQAVRELSKSGIDMQQLSIVGKTTKRKKASSATTRRVIA